MAPLIQSTIALAVLLGGCAGGSLTSDPGPPEDPVDPPPPETPAGKPTTWIYLQRLDDAGDAAAAEAVRLVPGDRPAWSPDGEWIAFERSGVVRMIRPDGRDERVVVEGWNPAWSPDGRRIAFVNDAGLSSILLENGGVALLVRHNFRTDTHAEWDMGVAKPSWSPDDTRIAFEHRGDGDTSPARIFVLYLGDLGISRLTSPQGMQFAESDPSWSPAGTEVVFWSFGHGLVRTGSGGGLQTIYKNFPTVSYGAKPAWSPDGEQILFNALLFTDSPREIWSISPAGGAATVFARGSANPAWSPDGKFVAMVRPDL